MSEGRMIVRVTVPKLILKVARGLKQRRNVQVLSLLVLNSFFLSPLRPVCFPALNCYMCPMAVFACPVGVAVQFSTVAVFPLFAVGVVGLTAAVLGRFACGWLCPFGLIQEWLHKIPLLKLSMPRALGYVRYGVLAFFVVGVPLYLRAKEHPLYFCSWCPMGTLEAAVPAGLAKAFASSRPVSAFVAASPMHFQLAVQEFAMSAMMWVKLGVLGAVVLAAVMIKRPFCRVVCPLGAAFSVFGRFSWLQLKVNKERCRTCEACARLCPVDLEPSKDAGSAECIACLECWTEFRCGGISASVSLRDKKADG